MRRKRKLLIIEDDPTLRDSLRRGFSKVGYEVTASASAEEGLGLVLGHLFDLILVDLKLPRNDGGSFTKQVRSIGCRAEVILMTAADVDPEETATAAGARALVPKGEDFFTRVREKVHAVLATAQGVSETTPV